MIASLAALGPQVSGSSGLVDAVRVHVDLILAHGKDSWGSSHTEFFVDGIHVDDFRPTVWREGETERVISNFASQQMFLRTLSALSTLTGDPTYQAQAEATIRAAFGTLTSPEGLLYWGGHIAFDLERDEAWGMWELGHEIKNHFPWFGGLAVVEPDASRRLMESIWLRHVADWEIVLFNRHGKISQPGQDRIGLNPVPNWDFPFDPDSELPLRPETSELTFANTGASLIYTALAHRSLTGSADLETWGLRLAERYWGMRHPETGLGGYLFNVRRQPDSGDKAQQQYEDILGEKAREWLLISALNTRQIVFPLSLLLSASEMPKDSPVRQRLIDETVTEWLGYHRYAYDASADLWYAIATDGTRLPFLQMTADGYYRPGTWEPLRSNGYALHLAALAYRLRPGSDTRSALASVLIGMNLASVEANGDFSLVLDVAAEHDAHVLHALVEIDTTFPALGALKVAETIATQMLSTKRVNGLFVPDRDRIWASINTPIPFAILRVVAQRMDLGTRLPLAYPDRGYLHAPFTGVASLNWGRTTDTHVFYRRTRAEPEVDRHPSTGR